MQIINNQLNKQHMALILTHQTENSNNNVHKISGTKIKSSKFENSYINKEIDEGVELLKKVYSASENFNKVIAKDRPAYNRFIQERKLVEEIFIKIQKELTIICNDNISYSTKFLLGVTLPENYFDWSSYIKEAIMALLLHEEVYKYLESIGVTEEILDDLLIRLKELDNLKYQAIEEEHLIQLLSEEETKHIEELKQHYPDLQSYLDLFEEGYSININDELGEAI